MTSKLVEDLECAYAKGEMEELKRSIVPFVRCNRDKILRFIEDFQKVEGPYPLEQLIKFFILQNNMPFDMRSYMQRQSCAIREDVGSCPDKQQRQAEVAEWIRKKAESHRSTSMFQQVFCFEKLKEEILPLIERELFLTPQPAI